MPETVSSLDELVEATHEEYERLEFEFDTGLLRMITGNLSSRGIEEEVAASVEETLDSHLNREQLKDRAMRFDDRKEPPNYRAFVLEVLREELLEETEKPDPRTLGENVLYCFDRDATVETGIPRGPVPLADIESLDEENVVYATGNQRLRKEADIPGVKDLHDGYASRTQGISMVWQNECDCVDATVAIDDVDVSEVADLDVYYEPWEFYLKTSEDRCLI
jgi:hypothetical protein